MRLRAVSYAKINLALTVGRLTFNRLHEIKTIIQTIDLADRLSFETSDADTAVYAGGDCPDGPENLVYKAIEKLRESYDFGGVTVTIEKSIPSGAGLGGASSNAAAALKAVCQLYNLKISDGNLLRISAEIGSDVPALLTGGCVYATGTGQIIEKMNSLFEKENIVLVKPNFSIATKDAYLGLDEMRDRVSCDFNLKEFTLADCANDFQSWAEARYPEISDLEETAKRYKPVASSLTGSGSAFFAVFTNKDKALEFKAEANNKPFVRHAYIAKAIDRGMDIE